MIAGFADGATPNSYVFIEMPVTRRVGPRSYRNPAWSLWVLPPPLTTPRYRTGAFRFALNRFGNPHAQLRLVTDRFRRGNPLRGGSQL